MEKPKLIAKITDPVDINKRCNDIRNILLDSNMNRLEQIGILESLKQEILIEIYGGINEE